MMSSSAFSENPKSTDTDEGHSDILSSSLARVKSSGSIDLASGCPDYMCPTFLTDFLYKAINSENHILHQYTRFDGHPKLVKTLSKVFSPLIGQHIDGFSDVVITNGALDAIASCITAFINPGDEVIVVEPFYIRYEPIIRSCGGLPVFVSLKDRHDTANRNPSSSRWTLDACELDEKMSNRTKLFILNNPNNPLGKVFSREELRTIADACKKHDVVCLADEVFERQIFNGHTHVRIASLPDMWHRTLTVGSAGKSFCAYGWKVGWCFGPASLIQAMKVAHLVTMSSTPSLLQEAVADALLMESSRMDTSESYFKLVSTKLETNRDILCSALECAGLTPIIPEGGNFLMVDITRESGGHCDSPSGSDTERDDLLPCVQYAQWLSEVEGLGAVPCHRFFSRENRTTGGRYIRFSLNKDRRTITEGANKIRTSHAR